MTYQFILLSLSFFILFLGAKWTLDSAEKIGYYFNLPALVIGLFIIGFGTSLPEFFVCHLAVWEKHEGIALGNILGSNIANIFFIMGIVAILSPINFDLKIRRQLYWHLGATLGLVLVLLKKELNYHTFIFLFLFFGLYLYFLFSGQKQDQQKTTESIGLMDAVKLIIGPVLLYFGGKLMVSSGSDLATSMGVSDYVVSAVFVALGTSLPELATAILAWRQKKNMDLITGNIIGSNIFNIAFVMGSLGFYRVSIPRDYLFEQILLLFAAVVVLIFSFLKKSFFRLSGCCFLLLYCVMIYIWSMN